MDKPIESDPLAGIVRTATAAVVFDTIADHDPLANQGERVDQQQLLPTSIQARSIGNIITSSSSALGDGTAASITIPNASSGKFQFRVADRLNRTIVAVPDVAWFIGSVTAATQWPNTTYGMGNMPSSGAYNDWGATDNINSVTTLVVRNNTGSDQYVIAVCRWRIITNTSAGFNQAVGSGLPLTGTQTPLIGSGGGGL